MEEWLGVWEVQREKTLVESLVDIIKVQHNNNDDEIGYYEDGLSKEKKGLYVEVIDLKFYIT